MFNPLILITLASIVAIGHGLYIIIYKKEIILKNRLDRRKSDIILQGQSAINFALVYIFGSVCLLLASTLFSPFFATRLAYLFLPTCIIGIFAWLIGFIYVYLNSSHREQ